MIMLAAIGWIACGILVAGFYNAYFQRRFPNVSKRFEIGVAAFIGVGGPVFLLVWVIFCAAGFPAFDYGWSLRIDPRRPEDFERARKMWSQ